MINERNLILDHPSENSVSAVHDTSKTTSNHQAHSDMTEVAMDDKASNLSPSIIDEEDHQDGGYGWFVVLGAFLVQVTTFGTCTSWCYARLL
ncbi:unnamed protein product [Rhizopus stolonifer]